MNVLRTKIETDMCLMSCGRASSRKQNMVIAVTVHEKSDSSIKLSQQNHVQATVIQLTNSTKGSMAFLPASDSFVAHR